MLTIQIPATQIAESAKAIRVRLTQSGRELWVPKSIGKLQPVCEVTYHPAHALPAEFRKPAAMALSVPEWWWRKNVT